VRLAFDGKALTEVWRLDTPGEARAIRMKGDTLYVADGPAGIAAVAIEGAQPKEMKRLALADMARDLDISADGAFAFVASGDDGVITVDLSKADALSQVNAMPLAKPVNRVTLYENRLIVGNDSAGLGILDISAPAKPIRVFPPEK